MSIKCICVFWLFRVISQNLIAIKDYRHFRTGQVDKKNKSSLIQVDRLQFIYVAIKIHFLDKLLKILHKPNRFFNNVIIKFLWRSYEHSFMVAWKPFTHVSPDIVLLKIILKNVLRSEHCKNA